MERSVEEILAVLRELVESKDKEGLVRFLNEELHPADLADIIDELDADERREILELLQDEVIAAVMHELDYDDQSAILRILGPDQASKILDEMSTDDIADLLGEVEPEEAGEILELLQEEEAAEVKELLGYKDDTAGGIMTPDFIAFPEHLSAHDAIEQMRIMAPDAETVYYLYVVDEDGKLVGVVSLRELIVAKPQTSLRDIMRRNVVSVHVNDDQEQVAKTISKYDLLAVPVINDDGVLLGIVTFDDAMDVIEEETTEDFYRMAGTGADEEEELLKGVWVKVSRRLPWLVFLLFTNFISANVIKGFTLTLEAVVALAYFIPVLMDMGGNVGTQSFAVVVRGLATGEVDRREVFRTVFKEAKVGLLLGLICGTLVSLVVLAWQGSPFLGLVVGAALSLTLITASVMGTLIPMVMERIGVDSAVAAGPFITTVVDVTALLIYFWLATMFMHRIA
ncbi:MAG: magnesium transporter [Bacillota bacterium]